MLGTETWLPEHSHVYAKHQTILVEEIAVDPLINDRDWNNQHSFLLLPILLCREGTSKQGPPIPWPQLSQALHCKCVLVMLFSWLGQGARACLGLCTHARRLMQWWQWQWTPIQLAGRRQRPWDRGDGEKMPMRAAADLGNWIRGQIWSRKGVYGVLITWEEGSFLRTLCLLDYGCFLRRGCVTESGLLCLLACSMGRAS
jgi:hypothetical protein